MAHSWDDLLAMEEAILRTVLYSDLFDYALTPDEIAHYLIGLRANAQAVRASLSSPIWLDGQVARIDEYFTMQGRVSLASRRAQRLRSSRRLWQRARRFIRILACLPFVRMVGVTGALAMDNSSGRDDIDVMIVTAPGRVWLTRAFSVILVYAGKFVGDTLCPNYVVSENALSLEQNLFVAHEFAQMVLVYGLEVHDRMRAANAWIETLLPNAGSPLHDEPEYRPGPIRSAVKRLAEWLLSGRLGDRLEAWEMRRKMEKFKTLLDRPGAAAVLDRDHVKGHFDDYGGPIMRRYERRLMDFELRPWCAIGGMGQPFDAHAAAPDAIRSAHYVYSSNCIADDRLNMSSEQL